MLCSILVKGKFELLLAHCEVKSISFLNEKQKNKNKRDLEEGMCPSANVSSTPDFLSRQMGEQFSHSSPPIGQTLMA